MINTSIAHYRITAKIGEGGMGEVYRATDDRLNRDVAIKLLPESFSADTSRVARFRREAQVLASLNHPNIGQIYGLEERDGRNAIILELIEGQTLDQRIARGAVPATEALMLALQIAQALEAAHEKGIVHRDLKPANVKITPDGMVKVLDFGLAKALDPDDPAREQPNPSHSPTLTAEATAAGIILGTAAYMSPEQAKGAPVDRRTDIWAFGVVFAEMLSGRRLFDAPTVAETLARVLTSTPDIADLPATVPAAIRRLLRRCLAREPRSRLHDIADARIVLEEVVADVGLGDEPPPGSATGLRPARRRPWWIAAGLVVATLAGWAGGLWLFPPRPVGAKRGIPLALSIVEPDLDPAHSFDLSPDGASMAITLETDGEYRIGIRKLDEFATRPLAHTEGGINPFYSPDGKSLGFLTRTGLHTISLDGSVPQTRLEFEGRVRFDPWDSGSNPTAVWLPDGRIVLSTGHWRSQVERPGLILVSPGGQVEELTRLEPEDGEYQHMNPEVAPDGRGVIFTCRPRRTSDRIEVVDLASRERRVLLDDAAEGHLFDGRYLVHLRAFYSTIGVSPLGPDMEITGPPRILFDDVSPYTSTAIRVTRNGALVYRRGALSGGNQQILEIDRNGAVTPLPIRPGDWMQPRLSPDGTRLLLRELGDQCTLWQMDLRRKVLSRITDPDQDYHDGIWSADGRSVIAGIQGAEVTRELVRVPATGHGRGELLLPGTQESDDAPPSRFPSSVSANGRFVVFTELGPGTDLDVWVLDTATGTTAAVAATPSIELGGSISGDGRWIAYASDEGGREEIYLVDWPGLERRIQVSDAGGSAPFWARDGGLLFYVHGDRILEVAVEGSGEEIRLDRPREILRHRMGPEGWWMADVFPDGNRFVILSPATDATEELRVVTGFASRLDRLFAGGNR